MRLLIQRVERAEVFIDGAVHSSINRGLLALVGIEDSDSCEDIEWLSGKVARLRVFDDRDGIMNLSLEGSGGDLMIVSQFTLHASTKKGNRPSYIRAAKPDTATPLYNKFVETMQTTLGKSVATGVFGAEMKIALVNDGPVTIWIDSKNRE